MPTCCIPAADSTNDVGLDHVGFPEPQREDLDTRRANLAALGVEHSPVSDGDSGSALVFRDPDNIQLKVWWTRPRPNPAPSS